MLLSLEGDFFCCLLLSVSTQLVFVTIFWPTSNEKQSSQPPRSEVRWLVSHHYTFWQAFFGYLSSHTELLANLLLADLCSSSLQRYKPLPYRVLLVSHVIFMVNYGFFISLLQPFSFLCCLLKFCCHTLPSFLCLSFNFWKHKCLSLLKNLLLIMHALGSFVICQYQR